MTDRKPSMLEIHSQALETVDESYNEFLLIYKKQAKCVYGFVDGKDDISFYKCLIQPQLPEGWTVKLIPSGNKEKVLRCLKNFTWRDLFRKRICFFIDRDLQDFLELQPKLETNLYITDGYSIENSILQHELVFRVLGDIYEITLLRPDEEEIIKQTFRNNEARFFEAILPLMGQILLWKRLGDKANLNNLKLDKFSSFSKENANFDAKERKELLQIAAKQLGCNLCDDSDIAEAENEIRRHKNCRLLIRGKYAFWFFFKQCEAISKAIPTLLPRFSKVNKRIVYGLDKAIIIFAPRARVPESLRNFVEQNYLSFIREQKSLDARDG